MVTTPPRDATGGPQVFYAADLDVTDWAARHARGEVPDRWPYGLNRLGGGPRSEPRTAAHWTSRSRALRKLDNRFDWAARAPVTGTAVCWDERTGVPVAASRRGGRVATGVIWLTDRRQERPLRDRLVRWALGRCELVWVNSEAQLDPLHEHWRVPVERLAYVPFGVDARFWTPAAEPAGRPEVATVLSVGNDRDRDHALTVRAMAGARRRAASPMRLQLVTRHDVAVPPELGARTASATHLELLAEYRRAAVVVVTTRPNLHVSGSTATLEAMACGLPVVVSATPGMTGYVRDGETGVLVPPGDEAALREAVLALLADPDAAARMGRAARAAVEARFTSAAMTEMLGALLDRSG